MTPEKNCEGCGSGIRAGAKFCPYCGQKATPQAEPAVDPPTQAGVTAPAAEAWPAETVTTPAVVAGPDATVTTPAVNGYGPDTLVTALAAAPNGSPTPPAETTQAFTPPPHLPNNGSPSGAWQAPPGWQPPGPPPARTSAPLPAAARDGAVPGLLWPVIGMFALAGVLTFLLFIFKLIGAGSIFGYGAGLAGGVFLLQALVFGGFAAACGLVARQLYTGNRIGPGLACAAAGAVLLNLVFVWHYSPGTEVGVVLVTLGMIAAACVVTFVPDARPHFAKPPQNPEQPTSIVVVQALLVTLGALAAFDALVYFLRAGVLYGAGRVAVSVLAGVLALATATLACTAIKGMLRGTGQGRVLVSVGAGVALLTVLLGFSNRATFVLMLAVALAAVCFTWLPADARVHFGDAPLTLGASAQRETSPAGAPAPGNGGINLNKPPAGGSGAAPPWQPYRPQQAAYPHAPAPSSSDERTWSMLAHLLGIVTGWVAPLIIMLTKGKESPSVRANAAEALNFEITLVIGYIPAWILFWILLFAAPIVGLVFGIIVFGGVSIAVLVLMIIACVRASRGEVYRYPVNIRMVR